MNSRSRQQIGAWVEKPGPAALVQIRSDLSIPIPQEGEVLIKFECTGVCHSDVHNIRGNTPMTTNIPGHEGVGYIIEVGPGVSQSLLKKRAGVKWIYSYCNKCEICAVDVTACPYQCNSGRDVSGTFQQYGLSPVEGLTMIPDELHSHIAAPLLCAGVSIYSAISKTGLKAGQWLVIPGAGGGLGHIGVQIARKRGFKVIAIDTNRHGQAKADFIVSRGEEKRKLCMNLGANTFLDFRSDDIPAMVKILTNGYGAHAVICLANSRAAYSQALSLLRNTGTLVCIGLGQEDLPISPFMVLVRGLKIIGSSVGTPQQADELLQMAVRKEVVPMVAVHDFEKLDDVLKALEKGEISGRVVVKLPL